MNRLFLNSELWSRVEEYTIQIGHLIKYKRVRDQYARKSDAGGESIEGIYIYMYKIIWGRLG